MNTLDGKLSFVYDNYKELSALEAEGLALDIVSFISACGGCYSFKELGEVEAQLEASGSFSEEGNTEYYELELNLPISFVSQELGVDVPSGEINIGSEAFDDLDQAFSESLVNIVDGELCRCYFLACKPVSNRVNRFVVQYKVERS